MCGIFGFVARGQKQMDMAQMKRIARTTMRRGAHAFGWAWVDPKNHLKMFKKPGAVANHIGMLGMAADAKMLIGHCRYATHGSPANNLNNHPHAADGGWLVHNGVIPDYWGAIKDFNLYPTTQCDTELIGLVFERLDGGITDRIVSATALADNNPLVVAGLWTKPNRLVIVRRGERNPLHIVTTPEGTYFASLSDDLPGLPEMLSSDSALEFIGNRTNELAV